MYYVRYDFEKYAAEIGIADSLTRQNLEHIVLIKERE